MAHTLAGQKYTTYITEAYARTITRTFTTSATRGEWDATVTAFRTYTDDDPLASTRDWQFRLLIAAVVLLVCVLLVVVLTCGTSVRRKEQHWEGSRGDGEGFGRQARGESDEC